MNEVHGSNVVGPDGVDGFAKFYVHPPHGRLVPELQTHRAIKTANFHHVDRPPLTAKHILDAPLLAPDIGFADRLDPLLREGRIAAPGLALIV